MNKRHLILTSASILLLVLLAACKSQSVLQPPAGSSGGEVPLYPNAQRITVSETDSVSFIKETFGSESLLYNSNTNISWTKDTGVKVKEQLDKLLPDSNWRLESDWSGFRQFHASIWRKGDLRVVLAYLDDVDSEQISELNRRYGIPVPETGATLIVTHIWDTTRLIPTATRTDTPIPSSTPIPSPTLTPSPTKPLPTNTPLPPTNTPAPTPTPVNFSEEFDKPSLDETVWEFAGPPIEFKDGVISLKSNLAVFPYVYARQNPFPVQGNFVLEISFRYPAITGRGAGLAADKVVPPVGADHNMENAFLSFWQRLDLPLSVYFGGNRVFVAPGNDITQHTIQLRYDGKYDVLVDGALVYTSPISEDRPTALWFGNPRNLGGDGEWTNLEIDYIRIKSTP